MMIGPLGSGGDGNQGPKHRHGKGVGSCRHGSPDLATTGKQAFEQNANKSRRSSYPRTGHLLEDYSFL